ncbi:putative ribonuclease H-like domain-containing protein, partial [Tanacetum coccineum]
MSQPANDVFSQHLSDDEASFHEDASDNGTATNKPKQQQQQLIPTTTTISNIKLPILKKEEYDIWAMEMEHYLEYIDNDVWKVIQNGNSKKRISTGKDGVIRVLPPVSAAEIHAVEKERKARTILLMAIPKEHLRRFHGMDDAKEIWEAIRTRFGGNANSKKMQKAVLKQQFEAFTISSSEGLEKGYDRFQQLLSQLEAHGAEVSTEDANHKFLRSLPPAWSNLAMTMRTKPDVDTLSIDDLYNNLRVFEQELTSTSKSSASAQNVAFVSHSKSSTNKVKSGHTGAYSTYTPSTSSNNIPEREVPAGFADEVIYSLFVKQSEDLDLLHEDLEQIDDLDIEEMDINWQIAMIAIRMKKFYKKTGRRVRIDGNQKTCEQEAKILAYNQAVKKLEAQIKIVDSWKDSSKNLWKLVNSGMTSNSKVGLGYRIKSNNEVLSYEEEMNCTVFNCTEEDFVDKPLYNRFFKTDKFKGVPHPLTGNYTPKPQQEIDESLYVYGKKGPQKHKTSVSDDKSNEHSTYQSNDSEGSFGNPSKHSSESESESISVPKEMSTSKSVTTNEKVMSEPKPKDVEPSCVTHVKTPSHLIKDCDFYEKKMAREAELKKQRVFNTGNGVAKPVWNNANRVNRANHFVPRPVQLNAVRSNVNTGRANVNTVRANVNSVRQNVNSVRTNINTVRSKQPVPTNNTNSFSPVRPQVNKFNQRSHFSKSHSPVRRPIVRNTTRMTYSHAVKGNWSTAVKTSAGYNWRGTRPNSNYNSGSNFDHPLKNMEDKGIFNSGCLGHMTGNKDHLDDYEVCKGGYVTFRGSNGYITCKGRIRVGNLDFDSVSFVKELGHFNLFSISQICDKHHKVLFTETECLVVSPDFKMPNKNQILLKVPRQHNMYNFDMKTPSLTKDYACLIAKATSDESKLWHRRLGHINFKNLNKLVKGNLVRGLPSKVFRNDHTCVACQKGKQHKASCKAKLERTITKPLHTLHMDLFGPTSVKSINHASYCLVITDDCTRFSWVFFLATKDETSGILQNFFRQIENQLNHRVKIIRSDNGTKFKNRDMLEFCGNKGIKQEYSNARTPQQNGVAERMNRTLIEAARTMLADSLLPTTFWAEANQTDPHAGTSEVTNIASNLQTPNANVSKEEDNAEELIVVPTTLKHTTVKVGPRKSSTSSKAEEYVTEPQNLKTQEKEAYSTCISEDSPKILAFRRELDELAQKHLREVPKNKATSTNSVNSGSGQDNTHPADQDDSDMPELTIFN